MALKFQKLKVVEVVRETPDAITIHFENPDRSLYSYIPGQYLTMKVEVNGKKLNRAYSLCSSPVTDNTLAVTVKRMSGGVVSNYLNDNLREGQELDVLPPLGNFVAKLDPAQKKHYVLVGAGSGITPLMSILKTVLRTEPGSKVTLVYGNRNSSAVIFREALNRLCADYPDRFKVIHSLTQPETGWTGICGRLTGTNLEEILKPIVNGDDMVKEYFTCGPSEMMDAAVAALKKMNVPQAQVHVEHFSAPLSHVEDEEKPQAPATPAGGDNVVREYEVTIILEGEERKITVRPHESVLEAALDNDMDPPYACMIGSCCTCKAKLMRGKVIMDDREGLTDEEIRDGFVLTCQSHPTTPDVLLNYDEV